MINEESLADSLSHFKGAVPFDHCIVDDFFDIDIAHKLSSQFISYDDRRWFYYKNPIEDKKALNDWNVFPPLTYRVLAYLNSADFISQIEPFIGVKLFADNGLNGGGWHMHAAGGNLNPHLDYSIHPKMELQRKLNIIIYLSEDLRPEHGGHLGLWANDAEHHRPGRLIKEIEPKFNRAVLFDTTQNSWHGLSRGLTQPSDIFRKSLAIYYLCQPIGAIDRRGRALFAPRESQYGDEEVERIIKMRAEVSSSACVYKTTQKKHTG